jgi:hypothetical protein
MEDENENIFRRKSRKSEQEKKVNFFGGKRMCIQKYFKAETFPKRKLL